MSRPRDLVSTLVSLISLAACGLISCDEVAKVASPDGRLEAVLIETNGGATTSFGYEIWVQKKGGWSGEQVGRLYSAVRSECAYGANLKWNDDRHLSVEYQEARTETLETPTLQISGREVHITFRANVSDPRAPCGGMLFNLQRGKR